MEQMLDFMAVAQGQEPEPITPVVIQDTQSIVYGMDADKACRILKRIYLPEIDRMREQAAGHMVVDDATQAEAVTMAGQAKKLAVAIEKKRKEVIDKPYEFVSTVNRFVKAFKDNLDEVERILKSRISERILIVQAEQRKEQARILAEQRAAQERARMEAEALAKLNPELAPEPIPEVPIVTPPVQNVFRSETGSSAHIRKEWVWEAITFSEIPHKYLQIDKVAINAAVKAGIRDIPGIRIYEMEKTVIRA